MGKSSFGYNLNVIYEYLAKKDETKTKYQIENFVSEYEKIVEAEYNVFKMSKGK